MRVLLTGATGFIGSHVARELLRRGHEVHCTLRPSSDRRRIADIEGRLAIHAGDLDHVPIRPDVAVHLAWYTVPGKYLTAPENRDCLEASRRLLAKLECRAVFAGTCFEFDTSLGKLREDSPVKPATLYSQCKDELRRDVERRKDSAWVRFFYQYGPWEDERRFVPNVILSLLQGREAKLSPGDQGRDYLHVEDVASAVCAVTESRLEGCVNVGSSEAPTIKEMASWIGGLAGRPELLRFGAMEYYPGEPMLIQAETAKLRSTGWKPRYGWKDGLGAAFEWWRGRTRS